MHRRGIERWIVLALLLQAALAAADIVASDEVVFTTTFVLAPFALAVTGHARATAALALVALVLAIASGYWNDYAGTTDHLLRIAIVAAGGILATLAAAALERSGEQRSRMTVLAAVGRVAGSEQFEQAAEGLAEALVPVAADGCWIELEVPGGTRRRLREFGAPAPETQYTGPARLLDGNTRALVPLTTADTTIGHLGLTTANGHYDAGDLAFFEIVADRVALVLANARLVTDLRSTQGRLDGILNGLAEAVTVNDDQGHTVYANAAATRLLGRSSPDEVTATRPGELAARFDITNEKGAPVGVDDLPGRRLVAGGQSSEMLTRTVDRVTGRSFWLLTKATPLHDQGRVFAVNIIEDVTNAKEAEQRQRFLARAGQLLASSLDYEQTLKRVAALAVPWLADWCAVDLPNGHGGIEHVALAHADPAQVTMAEDLRRRYPPDPNAHGGLPGVLRGGPAELVSEIPDSLLEQAIQDPEQLAAIRALGMRAVMIVPMRAGETTLGALTFVTAGSGRRFSDDDFAFAKDLALRAATAVQNARLYAEQARVAATLQASLLPDELPQMAGWDSAASYQAGELGSDVGGDFYDIVAVGGGRQLVFLGDVTGKGIAAAALTSLVRHSVRTAARFDAGPAAILRLVNEILVEQPRLAPVTLVCGLIEGATLTVAAAGHPQPLLKRGDSVSPIGPTGILLGAAGDQTFREETIALQPGDTVLLYTDGVTDTPGTEDRFGDERLADIFSAAPEAPIDTLARIEAALREFQAGTAIDDRAMLVLRLTRMTTI